MKPAGLLPGALVGALLLAGCTAGATSHSDETNHSGAAGNPALTAIQTAIADINQTAGGPVAAQRAVLERLVATDQAADQRACPTATTTLAFDPAYRGLQEAADGEYLLPTYITIYTGDRITGSDLATLHLWLVDGAARTSALCVS